MTLYRYRAVPKTATAGVSGVQDGELSGDSASEIRARLRHMGLQVVDVREVVPFSVPFLEAMVQRFRVHLRARRRLQRAELFDSLATMLRSGVALEDALSTVLEAVAPSRGALRTLLHQVRESLRSGISFSDACRSHETWFDPVELAILEAAEHSGTLDAVLRSLAEREERAAELSQKLLTALAYPSIVTAVGVAVLVFLSTHTLPELVRILEGAKIECPTLTASVMGFGQFLVAYGWLLLLIAVIGLMGMVSIRSMLLRRAVALPRWLSRLVPAFLRQVQVATFSRRLAELVRSGVPLVEGLSVLAPTVKSPSLRHQVELACERMKTGQSLSDALEREPWFDAEFHQLVEIGDTSGELESVLERLADRYERRARRLIDRAASLLEPAVILVLAALIGLVVMAAVLPMIRLQEML